MQENTNKNRTHEHGTGFFMTMPAMWEKCGKRQKFHIAKKSTDCYDKIRKKRGELHTDMRGHICETARIFL